MDIDTRYKNMVEKFSNLREWDFIFSDDELDDIARFAVDQMSKGYEAFTLRLLFEEITEKTYMPSYIWVSLSEIGLDGSIGAIHIHIPLNQKDSLETPQWLAELPVLKMDKRAFRYDMFA